MAKFIMFRKLIEQCIQNSISEQAFSRSTAEEQATATSFQLVQHLIKCLLFGPNCECLEYWAREVNTFLKGTMRTRVKPNNKRLKFRDLEKWCCDEWIGEREFKNEIDDAVSREKEFNPIGLTALERNYDGFIALYKQLLQCCAEGVYNETILKMKLDKWFETYEIDL